MIERVISGGQTGADQGGLRAARVLGVATGGTAPPGWQTEAGPAEDLLRGYGLVESAESGYAHRTLRNVLDSDATLLVGLVSSVGSNLTWRMCRGNSKPCAHVHWRAGVDPVGHEGRVARALRDWDIRVLNVAGNRESVNPGIGDATYWFVRAVLEQVLREAGGGHG